MIEFKEMVRENTGIHMMDSGGANGRQWQQPLPEKDFKLDVYEDDTNPKVYARMNTYRFLESNFKIDQKLTEQFLKYAEDVDDYWMSIIEDFMAEQFPEIKECCDDNTYNNENDLSQDFQYKIFSKDHDGDWYYDDDLLIVIQTHNGADIRGGYSTPAICRVSSNTETGWMDHTLGWSILEGTDENGEKLSEEECRELDREWEVGWASSPTHQFGKNIEKIISHDDDKCTVTVLLDSGETIKVTPHNWNLC